MLRSIRSSYTYSVIKVYCIVCYVCHANFKQKKHPNEYDAFFFTQSVTYLQDYITQSFRQIPSKIYFLTF